MINSSPPQSPTCQAPKSERVDAIVAFRSERRGRGRRHRDRDRRSRCGLRSICSSSCRGAPEHDERDRITASAKRSPPASSGAGRRCRS